MKDKIVIKGAREHNLKNISVEFPKNKLVVFTGISGSGKSSLAFDTIYAEGQRRYVESLSSYARQFLGVMGKPDVDFIEGLSPAISIDQKSTSHNPRSTVGTITEIYDYLRLLFAKIGIPNCPNCNAKIVKLTRAQIVDKILDQLSNLVKNYFRAPFRIMILSPVIRDRKGEFKDLFARLKMKGYRSVRIDGHVFFLNENITLIKTNKHTIEVVIDRITIDKKELKNKNKLSALRLRLSDSLEQALSLSEGLVVVSEVKDASFNFPEKPVKTKDTLYSQLFSCPSCDISIPDIEPRLFSFNSPHGACRDCNGLGSILRVNSQLVLNKNLSITEGAVLPFNRLILSDSWYGRTLLKAAKNIGIEVQEPLRKASEDKIEKLLHGTGDQIHEVEGENRYGKLTTIYEKFSGVVTELERRFSETESETVRNIISKYLHKEICKTCSGQRLKKEALSVTVDQLNIAQLTNLSIDKTLDWVNKLSQKLNEKEKEISLLILKELKSRLNFLTSVGLDYLTLNRTATSLAGGETQRIRLASQIGSGLSGVLYVLDEPSIGLHARDNKKLIKTLKRLRDLGNTVIVVEHDREMIESADLIIDFGKGAGKFGGKILAKGTLAQIKRSKNSVTADYLTNKKKILTNPKNNIIDSNSHLKIIGCSQNNLKSIDVSIPLQKLVCITGVSGSGKSSLIVDTLYHALGKFFNPYYREVAGKFDSLKGAQNLNKVILIDQSPIGRTPRSNPATYTKAFTYIRQLFSQLPESKERGYKPGRFSFNVKGGRCEACEGEGQIKIEMQFLPDVYITCDVCKGRRYNDETLQVRFKGKNISQILDMSVDEALKYFENIPSLYTKLETLHSVGLSYIQLGQPAPQLSGGEAQRVKLASELSKKNVSNTLYILDEPTTGLHFADLEKLLYVLKQLVDSGNTVIVIEHNLDVIKNADWIIDLGPEGGDRGGDIICTGTPKEVAFVKKSYTGQFLKRIV